MAGAMGDSAPARVRFLAGLAGGSMRRGGPFNREDPIGIAGGLNLDGFAGGDPINFSDLFGLCPPEDDEPCKDETSAEEEPPVITVSVNFGGQGTTAASHEIRSSPVGVRFRGWRSRSSWYWRSSWAAPRRRSGPTNSMMRPFPSIFAVDPHSTVHW